MEDYKKHILFSLGFDKQVENINNGKCAWCGSDKTKPGDFKDDLSQGEYENTKFCQKCQDETFNEN